MIRSAMNDIPEENYERAFGKKEAVAVGMDIYDTQNIYHFVAPKGATDVQCFFTEKKETDYLSLITATKRQDFADEKEPNDISHLWIDI